MNTILITGAAGFIGSHLAERLSEGSLVIGLDNFDPFYPEATKRANLRALLTRPGFRLHEADITDPAQIEAVFREHKPTHVVHLAAKAGVRPSILAPRDYVRTNVDGTMNILEACRQHAVKQIVFASSSSVYGSGHTPPFHEEMRIDRPLSPYAATKAAGEQLCHTYSHLFGMRIVCLRFFTVYGPRQRPDLAIHKFSRLIRERRAIPVLGDGGSTRDYTFIDDIISGVSAALSYDRSMFEIINLGESRTIRLDALIRLLEERIGIPAVIERKESDPGDLPATCADISKAVRLLGYNPSTPIERGLDVFLEWLASNDPLQKSRSAP
jgi:UDP-glucuronate 4-epimerase